MGVAKPTSAPAALHRGSRRRHDWYDVVWQGKRFFYLRAWLGCRSNGPAPLPSSGPAVIITNHPSMADLEFIAVGCRRPIYYLHAREAYESRLMGWLLRRACIPIDRDGRDVAGVRQALRLLRRGEVLCIAPEGIFSPEGGGVGPFKPGAAFLALHARAPVIPAWIFCRHETKSHVRAFLWPSESVYVRYGRPVDLSPYWERPITREVVREVTALLAQRMEQLHRAGRPPALTRKPHTAAGPDDRERGNGVGEPTPSAASAPAAPPRRDRPRHDWYDFLFMGFRLFARFWHGCRSNGPAPLPPSGPAVLILNHASFADILFIAVGCRRTLNYLVAREAYESPLMGWLYRRGSIRIARDGRDVAGVRRALRLLHRGEVLCIAPEGDFGPESGGLGPCKPGAAFLALHAQAPVIPAWIACRRETRNALRALFWPSGRVRVTYGRPVDLSPYWSRPIDSGMVREVTALLVDRLEQLRKASAPLAKSADRPIHAPDRTLDWIE